jgi:hypothetical protein
LAGQVRPLPEGPGKEETQRLCSQCHELDKSFSLSQDRAGWERTIEKMVAFGMKSTEQETKAVLEYLVKHFPADELPRINVNEAEAIELESGLSLKRSQAAAIITVPRAARPFQNYRRLEEGARRRRGQGRSEEGSPDIQRMKIWVVSRLTGKRVLAYPLRRKSQQRVRHGSDTTILRQR